MNNQDNYKKAIDQIHASDELKEKAFENAKYAAKSKKYSALKYLSTCAAVLVLFLVGVNYFNSQIKISENPELANKPEKDVKEEIIVAKGNLPRFKSMEELKEVIKKNGGYSDKEVYYGMNSEITFESAVPIITDSMATEGAFRNDVAELEEAKSDYSTTNVQVENVDEADIVKTDGDYIYYVSNNIVYIVKADNLEIISEIKIEKEDERFWISEIYLNKDKLVLIGTSHIILEPIVEEAEEKRNSISARYNSVSSAKAIVFNIKNKIYPEKEREVALEGNYIDSRLIGENLYLISRKNAFYYNDTPDNSILPVIEDSIIGNEVKTINCTDIAYFEGSKDNNFMMIGGFNINENEEVFIETLFGAGDTVYANEKSLYLTQNNYGWYDEEENNVLIYKFTLDENRMILTAKGAVKGNLNNQFSMDEYEGNLRIATTSTIVIEPEKTEEIAEGIMKTTRRETTTTNNLYILDEELNEIGKIENLANDERIYSVRFIGKVGYIVTFKQIDPLFVIDLSDPTNPTVKGELKIPGNSSYLHPYDENHIIGIGYNTKDNGHCGVTNANMKMSMFDVSDLENPQEIFNVDIGNQYTSSEITYNHKALFYKKSENLIGFPVTYKKYNYRDDSNGFIIFKIDLEDKEFEKYGEILNQIDYRTNVKRIIYIDDIVYALAEQKITSYDLNTFEKLNEVDLKNDEEYRYNEIYETEIMNDAIVE